MNIARHGNIEIRTHDDGSLDEIVMYDQSGKCVYHLEQMSDCGWWMACYGDEKTVHVNFSTFDESIHDDDDSDAPSLFANYDIEAPVSSQQ